MLSAMCADPPGSDSPAPLTVNYYLGCPNILVYDCFLNQFSILMLSFMIASWSLCWLNLVTIPPSPFWSPKLWFCGLQSPKKIYPKPHLVHPPSPISSKSPNARPDAALPGSAQLLFKALLLEALSAKRRDRANAHQGLLQRMEVECAMIPWRTHGMSLRKLFRSIHMCPAVFWSHMK